MVRGEFEKDLDAYINARKRSGFNPKAWIDRLLPKPSPKPIQLAEDVEVYEKPAPAPKEGLMQKWLKRSDKDEVTLLQSELRADDAVSDMKEIAKIALGMLRELPDEQLKTFKHSSEFERLKTILKKHELIK